MNVYVFVHVYIHVDVNYKCICSSCSAFKYKKYNFTVFFRQTPLQLTQKELPIQKNIYNQNLDKIALIYIQCYMNIMEVILLTHQQML